MTPRAARRVLLSQKRNVFLRAALPTADTARDKAHSKASSHVRVSTVSGALSTETYATTRPAAPRRPAQPPGAAALASCTAKGRRTIG